MYRLDYAERPHLDKQRCVMPHELVLLGVIRRSHRIRTRSHPIRIVGKILQPYVAATVRRHSDVIFSSIGAS